MLMVGLVVAPLLQISPLMGEPVLKVNIMILKPEW